MRCRRLPTDSVHALRRERMDRRTLPPGPKFSIEQRKQVNLRRFYGIGRIEQGFITKSCRGLASGS